MKSKIITLPNPSLRLPSRKIGLIDDKIKTINEEMLSQAKLWEEGRQHEITVGLAAIQINEPLKMIIIRQSVEPGTPATFDTLINPKITKLIGPRTVQLEGCLSIPDYYCNVERYETVKIEAQDINGDTHRLKATGFLARIIQHEIDHLKGITIVDQAIEVENEQGQAFKFCELRDDQTFAIVDAEELKKKSIL